MNLPLPKGDSAYAQAKRAEYLEKDTGKAKRLYLQALDAGDRAESAAKDLASILHQEGRTEEACELLLAYQHIFTDLPKFHNLLHSLKERLVPTAKALNRKIKISPLTEYDSIAYIRNLFNDPSRISGIEAFGSGHERFAILHFASHSAARKTLSTFHKWNRHAVEWVNCDGTVTGPVWDYKRKQRKRAPEIEDIVRAPSADNETATLLLGRDLLDELSGPSSLHADAVPFVPNIKL